MLCCKCVPILGSHMGRFTTANLECRIVGKCPISTVDSHFAYTGMVPRFDGNWFQSIWPYARLANRNLRLESFEYDTIRIS